MKNLHLKFKKQYKNLSNKEILRKLLEQVDQLTKPVKSSPQGEAFATKYVPVLHHSEPYAHTQARQINSPL